jgi:hypothetical protein
MGHGEAAKSAEVMTRELRKLILPFLKPVVSEFGGLFGDLAHLGRERIMKVLTSSKAKLAESGLEPQQVQTKTLVPLLQACALEDDENMIELWANLLASAASADSIPPVFVQTLSALSPDEARLLDALKKQQMELPRKSKPCIKVEEFRLSAPSPPQVFQRSIISLFRLGLVEMVFDAQLMGGYPHWPPIKDINFIGTTPFADEFLAACTRPPEMPANSSTRLP